MKLSGSTKKDVDQGKDGEDMPKLETVQVILVHYNLVNKNYQQKSKILFTFAPKYNTIWTVNHHSTSFINNAKHSKCKIFIH